MALFQRIFAGIKFDIKLVAGIKFKISMYLKKKQQ